MFAMRILLCVLLLAGCRHDASPSKPVYSRNPDTAYLVPGDLAVAEYAPTYDPGHVAVFDDAPVGERSTFRVPLGTVLVIVEPFEVRDLTQGDWLFCEVPAGHALDHQGKPTRKPARGAVARSALRLAPHPEASP